MSAGALCGYNYVAGEDGRRVLSLNTKYCDDWRYLSMKSFVRTGNACGREFAFDEIPNRLEPFGLRIEPGTAHAADRRFQRPRHRRGGLPPLAARWPTCPACIASSSMPLVSQIVSAIDGKLLLDSSACDSVPSMYSMLTGARQRIVVLAQAADYVKGPNKLMAILRQRYGLYPHYLERLQHRHYEYNRTYRALPPGPAIPESCSSSGLPDQFVGSVEHADELLALSQGYAKRTVAGPHSRRTWSKGRLSAPASQGRPSARNPPRAGPSSRAGPRTAARPRPKPQDVAPRRSRPHRSRRTSRRARARVEAAGRRVALAPV